MNPVVFSDKYNNHYLYSFSKRRLQYISRALFYILERYLENEYDVSTTVFPSSFDQEEITFALKQFYFYKEQGFLDEEIVNICTTFSAGDIRYSSIRVITFEVTQKCNLDCEYCVYGDMYLHEGNNHKKELTYEKAKAIIDFFYNQLSSSNNISNNKKVTIGFYGGEPLLKGKLIERIVDYVNTLSNPYFNFEYTMTTNGVLLDKYIDFLVTNNFKLLISLDGNYEASSYRLTTSGVNVFNRIQHNLILLKERFPIYFSDHVSFNSVLHDRNSIYDTIQYIKGKFNKLPMFSELSTGNVRYDKREMMNRMYKKIYQSVQQDIDKISIKDYLDINPMIRRLPVFFAKALGMNFDSWNSFLFNQYNEYIPTSTCLPFSFKVFVSADGLIHLCEKIGYEYSIGYISSDYQIIFDKEKIAEKYSEYFSLIKKECCHCYDFHFCITCLFERKMKCKAVGKEEFIESFVDNINLLLEKENLSKKL